MPNLMSLRYGAARSQLRAPLIWLRHWGLDSNDVFLASYARSGSTLLRFQLAEALTGASCSFDDIQNVVPEIGIHVHARPLFPGGGRLIKTHEPYRDKYQRGIYIARDVRDVLLSAFTRENAFNLLNTRTLDDYIEPFMQGKMTRYGSWQDHVSGWLDSPLANRGGLLVLRYEEMRLDVFGSLTRALQFLNVEMDAPAIQKICVSNSIENMRPKEDRARKLPKPAGEEGRQVGKGSVQGWRKKLTEEQLQLIDHYAGPTLLRLGYPTALDALQAKNGPEQAPQLKSMSIGEGSASRRAEGANHSSAGILSTIRERKKATAGLVADYFSWYRY
jgi:hypothetical protein